MKLSGDICQCNLDNRAYPSEFITPHETADQLGLTVNHNLSRNDMERWQRDEAGGKENGKGGVLQRGLSNSKSEYSIITGVL